MHETVVPVATAGRVVLDCWIALGVPAAPPTVALGPAVVAAAAGVVAAAAGVVVDCAVALTARAARAANETNERMTAK